MIPLALLFSVTVLYVQGKSANLLSIGAVDFGIIVDSSVIIVENIYRHITAHERRPVAAVDRPDHRGVARDRAGPVLLDDDHRLRVHPAVLDDRARRGAVRADGQHLRLRDLSAPCCWPLTLAPVLCSFLFHNKKEETRHVRRPADEAALPPGAQTGSCGTATLTLAVMGGLLVVHVRSWSRTWAASSCRRSRRGTSGSARCCRGPSRSRRRPDRPAAARGDRVGPRGPRGDVARRPARRRHRRHQLLQHRVQRPAEADGAVAHAEGAGSGASTLWERDDHPRGDPGRADGEVPGVPGHQLQLLAVDPRQRRGGALGRQGGELGQALRQRPRRRWRRPASGSSNILRTVPGIENVGLFHIVGQPNLEIEIDRDACARYGVNVADVEAAVQVAIGGQAFSQMVEGEKLYDIVLRLPLGPARRPRRHRPDPGRRAPAGRRPARRPRSRSASSPTIHPHKPGASYIYRENNRRFIPIKFSVQGRDLASAIAEAQQQGRRPRRPAPSCPQGYRIEWSGEFAQMQEANARLMWIVPLSIGLIMVLLYTAFNSMKDALLVMVNVVAATMGGVWALLADRHAVQHLGGRRVHLDLRRRRPGRRAPDLVLQPDAGQRLPRARGGDARGRAAGPARWS